MVVPGPPSPLGCLLRILGVFGTLFLLAVVAVVILAFLAFAGSPGNCGEGIPAGTDLQAAAAFQQKIVLVNAALVYRQPAQMTTDEREATARARQFLAQNDTPVKNLALCFEPGRAVGKAHVDTPVFGGLDVQVKGTVDLTGQHPKVNVEEVRLGALPSFFTAPFKGIISRIADDQADRILLIGRYDVQFDQGRATLVGTPR